MVTQDVEAAKPQAAANLQTAKSNLESAKAEPAEAILFLNRNRELTVEALDGIKAGEQEIPGARESSSE